MQSYDGVKSQDLEFFLAIFAFFGETTPYGKIVKILFRNLSPPHRSSLLCVQNSNVVKFVRREIGEIVRYYLTKKQNFGSLSNCRYCADRAQKFASASPQHLAHSVTNFIQIGSFSAEL